MACRLASLLRRVDLETFPMQLKLRTYENEDGDVLEVRTRVRGKYMVLAKETIPRWVKGDSVLVYLQRALHKAVLGRLDASVRVRGEKVFAHKSL